MEKLRFTVRRIYYPITLEGQRVSAYFAAVDEATGLSQKISLSRKECQDLVDILNSNPEAPIFNLELYRAFMILPEYVVVNLSKFGNIYLSNEKQDLLAHHLQVLLRGIPTSMEPSEDNRGVIIKCDVNKMARILEWYRIYKEEGGNYEPEQGL